MSAKKFDVGPATKPSEATKQYTYRKHNNKGQNRETVSYSIPPELADKIERMAYWERRDKSDIAEEIFTAYFKGKDWEPIPETAKRKRNQ